MLAVLSVRDVITVGAGLGLLAAACWRVFMAVEGPLRLEVLGLGFQPSEAGALIF